MMREDHMKCYITQLDAKYELSSMATNAFLFNSFGIVFVQEKDEPVIYIPKIILLKMDWSYWYLSMVAFIVHQASFFLGDL